MMQILQDNDPAFENFCSYVCSWCVNGNDCCHPLDDSCEWNDDFEEARLLLSKSFYLEEDPDCIYGSSEDDYDFEAQAKACNNVDERLRELKNSLISNVQENQIDYHRYYAYEL